MPLSKHSKYCKISNSIDIFIKKDKSDDNNPYKTIEKTQNIFQKYQTDANIVIT